MTQVTKLAAPLAVSLSVMAGAAFAQDNSEPGSPFQCATRDLSAMSMADRLEVLMPANVYIETSILQEAPAAESEQPEAPEGEAPEEAPGNSPEGAQPPDGPFEEIPEMPPANALGSGYIIDPSGLILTNNHVIDGADEITVTLYDANTPSNMGEKHTATLVGTDPDLDLAVLKIETGAALPCVSLGDSDGVRRGDEAFAIGNPLGQAFSLSSGYISHPNQSLRQSGSSLFDYIQTDAAINRGNSGGGLYNLAGQVIGTNTAILSPNGGSIGLGFAIKANDIAESAAEIITTGTPQRGALGVQIQELTAELKEETGLEGGALVMGVAPEKAAALAGMIANDIIIQVEDEVIDDTVELTREIASYDPGDQVSITVLREGVEQVLEAVLQERGASLKAFTPEGSPEGEEGPAPEEPTMEEMMMEMQREMLKELLPEILPQILHDLYPEQFEAPEVEMEMPPFLRELLENILPDALPVPAPEGLPEFKLPDSRPPLGFAPVPNGEFKLPEYVPDGPNGP